MQQKKILAFFVLGLSIVIAAFLLSRSIQSFSVSKQTVSVKGFADREVKADLVVWPIRINTGASDIPGVKVAMQKSIDIVTDFLQSNGFDKSEITFSVPEIRDNQIDAYYDGANKNKFRYIVTLGITLRTSKVDSAIQAIGRSYDLISRGVLLTDRWSSPKFLFTKLDEIKPDMIAQATTNSHEAAMQFAKGSGGKKVGAIQQASQGLFSIDDRDEASPQFKNVRVVVNVSYFLE